MADQLCGAFPTCLRVRGSVVVLQQRISLRLFGGAGLSLIAAVLLWVAGMAWQTAATLLTVAVAGLFLCVELSWGGRSAPRWLLLAWRAYTEPRVLFLQPERVVLTTEAMIVTPLPVRWAATAGAPGMSPVERRRDATG